MLQLVVFVILNTYHCILSCDTTQIGRYIQMFWRPSEFPALSLLLHSVSTPVQVLYSLRLLARPGLEGVASLF